MNRLDELKELYGKLLDVREYALKQRVITHASNGQFDKIKRQIEADIAKEVIRAPRDT